MSNPSQPNARPLLTGLHLVASVDALLTHQQMRSGMIDVACREIETTKK